MEGWGGSVLSDAGDVTVDSDQSKEGLQALVDAYENGTIASASTSATEEETNLAFVAGDTAYAINWPYMFTNAEADTSEVAGKFEVQPLVGKDGVGVSTLGGYNNGININSENKATARTMGSSSTRTTSVPSLGRPSASAVLHLRGRGPHQEFRTWACGSRWKAAPRPASELRRAVKAIRTTPPSPAVERRVSDRDMASAIGSVVCPLSAPSPVSLLQAVGRSR